MQQSLFVYAAVAVVIAIVVIAVAQRNLITICATNLKLQQGVDDYIVYLSDNKSITKSKTIMKKSSTTSSYSTLLLILRTICMKLENCYLEVE